MQNVNFLKSHEKTCSKKNKKDKMIELDEILVYLYPHNPLGMHTGLELCCSTLLCGALRD